jgi:hypothetical protein
LSFRFVDVRAAHAATLANSGRSGPGRGRRADGCSALSRESSRVRQARLLPSLSVPGCPESARPPVAPVHLEAPIKTTYAAFSSRSPPQHDKAVIGFGAHAEKGAPVGLFGSGSLTSPPHDEAAAPARRVNGHSGAARNRRIAFRYHDGAPRQASRALLFAGAMISGSESSCASIRRLARFSWLVR